MESLVVVGSLLARVGLQIVLHTPLIIRKIEGIGLLVNQAVLFTILALLLQPGSGGSLPLYMLLFFTILRYLKRSFQVFNG